MYFHSAGFSQELAQLSLSDSCKPNTHFHGVPEYRSIQKYTFLCCCKSPVPHSSKITGDDGFVLLSVRISFHV